jgi:dynein light intermediate chain
MSDFAESKVNPNEMSSALDSIVEVSSNPILIALPSVQDSSNQPRESLVQYNPPEIHDNNNNANKTPSKSLNSPNKIKSKSDAKKSALNDILNSILPARQYNDPDSGLLLQQSVSTANCSREDVLLLQQRLDERLAARQARENGICPIREELYSQCFDELIRQATIESPERGLLLLRIRDEIRMSIASYQTLYSSSITFGMKKTLQAESGIVDLQNKLSALEADNKQLQGQLMDQKALHESIEKRINENKAVEEKKQQEEKDFLKFQAQHLESFLKNANS